MSFCAEQEEFISKEMTFPSSKPFSISIITRRDEIFNKKKCFQIKSIEMNVGVFAFSFPASFDRRFRGIRDRRFFRTSKHENPSDKNYFPLHFKIKVSLNFSRLAGETNKRRKSFCSFCKCIFISDKKLVCLPSHQKLLPRWKALQFAKKDVIRVNGTNCYNIAVIRIQCFDLIAMKGE